jgi:hypothetical protein
MFVGTGRVSTTGLAVSAYQLAGHYPWNDTADDI